MKVVMNRAAKTSSDAMPERESRLRRCARPQVSQAALPSDLIVAKLMEEFRQMTNAIHFSINIPIEFLRSGREAV
jgi:hypothetical protein